MATALDLRDRSLEAFLAWEEQQPERHERVDGFIWMMTGGTLDHNRITLNARDALRQRLEGRGCEIFVNDIKVVTPRNDVMYPDAVVVCGELFGKTTRVEAPVLVVEVLSESTAAHDHGRKRWAYQTIPSLRHYVLIDQYQPVVEIASRDDDGSWRSVIHRGLDGLVHLTALGIEIGLEEIFARVTFAPTSPAGGPSDRTDQGR